MSVQERRIAERSSYGFTEMFHRLVWLRWLKPAGAGFLVGLLGLVLPGEHWGAMTAGDAEAARGGATVP